MAEKEKKTENKEGRDSVCVCDVDNVQLDSVGKSDTRGGRATNFHALHGVHQGILGGHAARRVSLVSAGVASNTQLAWTRHLVRGHVIRGGDGGDGREGGHGGHGAGR